MSRILFVPVAVVLSLALAVAADLLPAAPKAQASHQVSVNITGNVTEPTMPLTLFVSASGRGTAASLTGSGVDVPHHPGGFSGGAPGNPGVCEIKFTSGTVAGNVVTLSGTVTQATDPSFLGAPVGIVANAATDAITFTFGPFVFTGTGSVSIHAAGP